MAVVRGPLRTAAHAAAPAGTTAMAGGTALVFADVSDPVDRDMSLPGSCSTRWSSPRSAARRSPRRPGAGRGGPVARSEPEVTRDA